MSLVDDSEKNQALEKLKIRDFWYIGPCNLELDPRFTGAYCLYHQGNECITLMMEAVCTSERSVYSIRLHSPIFRRL
jgi:hypothetical protein